MARIHITLQGKGGVGKSYISSLLAQHLIESGREVVCIDTDPVNKTFHQYRAFPVEPLEILDGTRVNERNFDRLMEILLTRQGEEFIIDNGASSFIPLSNYLIENQAVELLAEHGHEVVVHTVVTGGQALLDTLNGFRSVVTQFVEGTRIIVWLNEYFGAVAAEGKDFEKMKVYTEHRERVTGLIRLKQLSADTYGRDVEEMLNRKLTFDEAIGHGEFALMAKQRLKMVKRALWEQMALMG